MERARIGGGAEQAEEGVEGVRSSNIRETSRARTSKGPIGRRMEGREDKELTGGSSNRGGQEEQEEQEGQELAVVVAAAAFRASSSSTGRRSSRA